MLSPKYRETVATLLFGNIEVGDKTFDTIRICHEVMENNFIQFARVMWDTSNRKAVELLVIDIQSGCVFRDHSGCVDNPEVAEQVDRSARLHTERIANAMEMQKAKVLKNIADAEKTVNEARAYGREPRVLY